MSPAKGSEYGYSEDVLLESTTETASGNSADLEGYGGAETLRVQLEITDSGGTSPTLDVTIEDTLDGTNYHTIGTFSQAAAASVEVIDITTPFSDTLRVSWAIGGTAPTFTFNVKAASQSPLA